MREKPWFSMPRNVQWCPIFQISSEGFMFDDVTGGLVTGFFILRSGKDLRAHLVYPLSLKVLPKQASVTKLIINSARSRTQVT